MTAIEALVFAALIFTPGIMLGVIAIVAMSRHERFMEGMMDDDDR